VGGVLICRHCETGVDFEQHQREGIDVEEFGGLMMVSGLALCEEVRWISFHSYFDFGYLVKVLTNSKLPEKESDFFALLSDYFPCFFDIKYIMKSCESLKGGLNRIAETLEVKKKFMHVGVRGKKSVFVSVSVSVCMCVHVCVYECTMCKSIYIHSCTYIYMYIYIYKYIYI